jgi:endonuclease YncB( thermonuclease family)
MGTIHQLRWDPPRTRPAADIQPRRALRPADLLLLFGILFIAAAIGAKAFWREGAPPRVALSVQVIDGDSLRNGNEQIRLVGIDAPELRQTCRDLQGREWSCGRAAKARLAELVA